MDTTLRDNAIKQILNLGAGRIMALEEKSNELKIYNTRLDPLDVFRSPKLTKFDERGTFL